MVGQGPSAQDPHFCSAWWPVQRGTREADGRSIF
ncbi:hypothetical protein M877_06235 [Streptomyces niveus NCIMB 11891]|nr:hypothetical protein M877_06235 [Streptomyces niveus NCIMB 11891]